MDYKSIIASCIELDGLSREEITSAIAVSQDEKNGDYCLPCFKFAGKLR